MLAARLKAPIKGLRALSSLSTSSTSVSPTLLANSRRRVEQQQEKASDQLGDVMIKRWLGGAGAVGPDTDRVSLIKLQRRLELIDRERPRNFNAPGNHCEAAVLASISP